MNPLIFQEEIENAKILIVDDQRSLVMLFEHMLRSSGFKNFRSTTDPRNAVLIYQEYQPDLVLLDLVMPHMDGFEVMKQLKQVDSVPKLSIMVLTSQSQKEIRIRALQNGAKDFINKPFDRLEVVTRIRNLIMDRLLHKQISSQNEILEAKVIQRTEEVTKTQLEIIRRLGRAVEYRDNDTGMHIIRMSHYSALLGNAAGMNDKEVELILHASPMHDIGKIAIPDSILLKPSQLTPDEWEMMKTHTTIGANILEGHNSELMSMACQIAMTHHEKWDGSGYPKGLKGEEIPLNGRICAICDVFDSLTSWRPYKKAWSVDEAVAEIEKNSGKAFDPQLVCLFIENLPDILFFKDKYAETPTTNEETLFL